MIAVGSAGASNSVAGVPAVASTSLAERSDLVLRFGQVLQANGQSTDETLVATQQLANHLGLSGSIIARWGELQLQAEAAGDRVFAVLAADPSGVDMTRVAAAMQAIDEIRKGRLAPPSAAEAVRAISRLPPSPTWLFTLAAAAGAGALAVIFGVEHLSSVALIVVSAAIGAVLRRTVAR